MTAKRRVAILISGSGSNMVSLVKSMQAKAHPAEPVLVPGDPERATRVERGANGIDVDAETWTQIKAGAALFGVAEAEMDRIAAVS